MQPNQLSNDLLKGVETGTTARTRIGNKVRVKYVKGAFTFSAAMVDTYVLKGQGGEALAVTTGARKNDYLRTTYRFALGGFRKDVEKKYFDKTLQADTNDTLTGNVTVGA